MRSVALILGAVVAATVIACSSDDDPLPTAAPTTASQPTVAPAPTDVPPTASPTPVVATEPTSAPEPTTVPAAMEPSVPAAGSGGTADLVIPIGALNDSGQTGIASFTANGDQTAVVISISSGAADVPQPIHIHDGACDTLGGVAHALSAVVNGSSVTTVDATLASIMGGANAVNIHLSGDDAGTYVACGDIPIEGDVTTIALGALNDSGQSGTASLIANGSQTTVVLSIAPGAAGVGQPVHIHQGTCDTLGGVEYPLTAVSNGVSVSTVDAAVAALLAGGFSINAHESGENAGNYVSCGELDGGTSTASIGVGTDSDLGSILVDGAGRSLYIFDRDTEGVSNCSGGCLGAWPPLLTDGEPVALGGVDAVLGTITRDDGTLQVTVNDFPAYYWQNDANAGDTLGHGRGSVWWVFNADGSPQRPAKVGLAENATLGNILTDGAGRSLYIFDRDTVGVSNCSGGCLDAWPPLLTEYPPAPLEGVEATLGTVTRDDGTLQVTVNGMPAYYWQNDANAGDTLGHGRGSVWWVFNADGSPQRPAKVGLAENATLGNILTDGAGLTLYLFDNDEVGVSNCSGGCLANWPPFLTVYDPVGLEGVEATVGTITRDDGTLQVTVNGMPAYYWVSDAVSGDTDGQAKGGVWWVMDSSGAAIRS